MNNNAKIASSDLKLLFKLFIKAFNARYKGIKAVKSLINLKFCKLI